MSTDFKPEKPDYFVSAYHPVAVKKKGEPELVKGTVGAAWTKEDGSIDIKLNPFVVLDNTSEQVRLRLWPRKESE